MYIYAGMPVQVVVQAVVQDNFLIIRLRCKRCKKCMDYQTEGGGVCFGSTVLRGTYCRCRG